MKYIHIGWCKEGIHDKVWGIILIAEDVKPSNTRSGKVSWPFESNKYVTFWGRRGSKLQTKTWNGDPDTADEMFDKKLRNGYSKIKVDELDEVYPEFKSDLEKTAIWAILKL